MVEKIELFRKMNSIIIPYEFTYFSHATSYIPLYIKDRMENGIYVKSWTELPISSFVIKREMSFLERNQRIKEVFDYNNELSSASIMYTLPDYSKPFNIRVIIPKLEMVQSGEIAVDEDYKQELIKIYCGYGDYRHPKLNNGEKIYIIGSSLNDEVSGKMIDIFYGIREKDIDIYYEYVVRTIKRGYDNNPQVDLSTRNEFGIFTNFYPNSYCLYKNSNMDRYISKGANPSEFEMELLNDYSADLAKQGEVIKPFSMRESFKYHDLYRNYRNKKNSISK